MKAKIFSAEVKGVFTHIKAYYKINAINEFKKMDNTIQGKQVRKINVINSTTPIDSLKNLMQWKITT